MRVVFHSANRIFRNYLLVRRCLLSWSSVKLRTSCWLKVRAFVCTQLHVTSLVFLQNKVGWLFSHVGWIWREMILLLSKKMISVLFICDFIMWAFLGLGDAGVCLCMLCHLPSMSYWKHHISSSVISFNKTLFGISLIKSEHTSDCIIQNMKWACYQQGVSQKFPDWAVSQF